MTALAVAPPLEFHVIPQRHSIPSNVCCRVYLREDAWDDWGKYCTQFYLTVVDADGKSHQVGNVKIGSFGLKEHAPAATLPENSRSPAVPPHFTELADQFFSVGQSEEYYENLTALGSSTRESVLTALRDVAFVEAIWDRAKDQNVMQESLLRSMTHTTVEGQYRRMSRGGARLTRYRFSYHPPKRMGGGEPPFVLDFRVDPEVSPPTNVHVLIGRNGVGKTRILSLMTKALVAPDPSARQSGSFEWPQLPCGADGFANLVTVSFNAFDDTEILPEGSAAQDGPKYSYIGLRRHAEENRTPKTPEMLTTEFINSLKQCQVEPRRRRWLEGMNGLMGDPVFRAASLDELIASDLSDQEQKRAVVQTFDRLSAGHKIVALTLTQLVRTVEERTLVLIDELESHLHPPLLAAFIRTLSRLLVDRNGVAIVATHSPVILQEVPKTCVWVLSRIQNEAKAERPSTETFGENVGVLTREVFQLELTQSGFHDLLREAAASTQSYSSAVDHFAGQLGAEAKAVLKAIMLENEKSAGT